MQKLHKGYAIILACEGGTADLSPGYDARSRAATSLHSPYIEGQSLWLFLTYLALWLQATASAQLSTHFLLVSKTQSFHNAA